MIDVFHVRTFTVRKAASLITADMYMPTTLANFVGKVVTFYHAFVSLPSPLFNVGFQWTVHLQYCLANIQH